MPRLQPGSPGPGGTESAVGGHVSDGEPGCSPWLLSGLLCSSAFTRCLTTWRSDEVVFLPPGEGEDPSSRQSPVMPVHARLQVLPLGWSGGRVGS